MKILINRMAFGGNALKKIQALQNLLKDVKAEILPTSPLVMNAQIEGFSEKENSINLAGGDGTFHCSINFLLNRWPEFFSKNTLGLVGVGSSNSLLKSLQSPSKKSPLFFLNHQAPVEIDLGEIKIDHKLIYFLANGSVGLLALGNFLFNQPSKLVGWSKKISTELANFLVFLQLLKNYHPMTLVIKTKDLRSDQNKDKNPEIKREGKFLNIQFLKAQFYTGGYSFPSDNTMDSGFFDLHLFRYHSKWQTLKTFVLLSLNRTEQIPDHEVLRVRDLEISGAQPFLLEVDGEIYESSHFKITCHQKKIKVAGWGLPS